MLKDITLGQFFPGNSVVHKLDPRAKLLLTMLFIVSVFISGSVWAYLINAAFLILTVILSGIKFSVIFKGYKPLLAILVFTAALNLLFTPGDALFEWRFIHVTDRGLRLALLMLARILMLVTATFMLTYTTSPMALTDALERVMSPLKRLKLPVHEVAMMMTIALRMIPTLIEETEKVISAQKSRGADFETGNVARRARAMLPIMIPLLVGAFRRADELASAMESKCYRGGNGRTRLNRSRFAPRDAFAACAVIALTAAAAVITGLCAT